MDGCLRRAGFSERQNFQFRIGAKRERKYAAKAALDRTTAGDIGESRALLWNDLDGGNSCVILDRNEFQQELPLRVGLQAADPAHHRAPFASLLKNIDVAQDELAIAEHVEEPGS